MAIGSSFDDFLEEEGLLVGCEEVARARTKAREERLFEEMRAKSRASGWLPIDIGFTGTRAGMSDEQKQTLMRLLAEFRKPCRLHHGMCVGADAEAHAICRDMDIQLEGHPPRVTIMMARGLEGFAAMREPMHYLVRNCAIVNATQSLIAAPGLTSAGTWSTIRYALELGRKVTIIFRNGNTETKNRGAS
jgi:hypothetical protein